MLFINAQGVVLLFVFMLLNEHTGTSARKKYVKHLVSKEKNTRDFLL